MTCVNCCIFLHFAKSHTSTVDPYVLRLLNFGDIHGKGKRAKSAKYKFANI